MWQLVGGHYEAHDGSLRAAMLRELAEELESDSVGADPDLQLSELGPPFAIERSSPTYGLLTRTVFQAYMLRWPAASLVTGERLRWVTAAELERERTTDARPISAAPVRLLAARERVTIAALIEVLSV
jgi:8-oxo-dGTP pyrophosphatase MutT (NUDIX family)